MAFSEKLNSLMSTFAVSNRRLATALSVDPSLISRWRNGTRTPSGKNTYFEDIAAFFVNRIEKTSQKTALLEILQLPLSLSIELDELEKNLHNWLQNSRFPDNIMVENLLSQLQAYGKNIPAAPSAPASLELPKGQPSKAEVFYGIEGKQSGVLQFLTMVLSAPTPMTLLMLSDESMEWLIDDPEYFSIWGYFASMVLKKGHRIRVIHTLLRDMKEMHEAIQRWLPLYVTGGIEPYYYPRYREQIFRRTLFVAPGLASFTSISLPDTANQASQLLSTDPRTVHSHAEEFNRFLSFCRPLMKIVTHDEHNVISSLRSEMEEQAGDIIISGIFPSSLTISEPLMSSLTKDHDGDQERILKEHQKRRTWFEQHLEHHHYTEILHLPPGEDLLKRAVLSDFALHYFTGHLPYTQHDLRTHLLHLVDLLERYPRFHLYLSPEPGHGPLYLAAKENIGVLIQKADHPLMSFAFNQTNLAHTFYQYLETLQERIVNEHRERHYIINKLREMAN